LILKLSVVILNYNVRYFLELCLQSVEAALQDIASEIIVIDNNSQDGSCEMVVSKFPSVVLIKNSTNVGFSKANNQAVQRASGEYVCILNPDTVIAEDSFDKLLDFADKKSNLGIIGCRLIDGSGVFLPESKRNIPHLKIAIQKILGLSKPYYATHLKEHSIGKVDVLVGAFMLLKRRLYNSLEGFDEDYFMYGEDIDLSYKSLKEGYDNYYYGELSAIHYKGESTVKDLGYLRRFYGAMKIFYSKHFQTNRLFDFLIYLVIKCMVLLPSSKHRPSRLVSNSLLLTDKSHPGIIRKLNPKISSSFDKLAPNTQLIFDAAYLSFKTIIDQLQNFNNHDCVFKIQPKNCSYIVGSSSADTHGEIIQF